MSYRSHCQQCGRRLRDAIFCPRCGQFLCSWRCLDEHEEKHLRLAAGPQGPVETAAPDMPLPSVQGITLGQSSVARRMRPWNSSRPGDQ
jgi:hypothetical protein